MHTIKSTKYKILVSFQKIKKPTDFLVENRYAAANNLASNNLQPLNNTGVQ